jgi:hypothetical protein
LTCLSVEAAVAEAVEAAVVEAVTADVAGAATALSVSSLPTNSKALKRSGKCKVSDTH